MEQKDQSFLEKTKTKIQKSITVRIFTIGFLILLLLIPVSMIQDLIRERQYRQQEAFRDVSSLWAHEQTITGPVLTVPYKVFTRVQNTQSKQFEMIESLGYAHFFPEELRVQGNVMPQERYRGIYKVIVYNSHLQLSGTFIQPNFKDIDIPLEHVLWEKAYVSIGISDLRGIQEQIVMNWQGDAFYFDPGVQNRDIISRGVSVDVPILTYFEQGLAMNFSVELHCNGSSRLAFTPLGKTTEVELRALWGTPKFDGAFLPETRIVSQDSVYAKWKVLHLNRAYPQQLTSAHSAIKESEFGVTLKVPVDSYQKSMRTAKYASLFITLTFLIFFFIQILQSVQIHPIQYIIVGLALCVFYTLLIALSEHISFGLSYLIASVGIVGLIAMYAYFMFNSQKIIILFVLLLSLLYGFIFTIIQSEDYALLMGSIGLFIVLGVVMFLSRKINWYNTSE